MKPTDKPYPITAQVKRLFEQWLTGKPYAAVRKQLKAAKPGHSLKVTFTKLIGGSTWAVARAKRTAARKAAQKAERAA
jgi:hypothetical protein